MTRVKMLQSVASSEGWAYAFGQVVEVDAPLAKAWVQGGMAEYVPGTSAEPVHRAALSPPENTAHPKTKGKTK